MFMSTIIIIDIRTHFYVHYCDTLKRKFCLRANEIFEKIIYNFIRNIKVVQFVSLT